MPGFKSKHGNKSAPHDVLDELDQHWFRQWFYVSSIIIAKKNLIWNRCAWRSSYYTPRNEVRGGGGILDSPCLSVCPLTFRVRPVASAVQDGFFPYLVQMINSMRGCVACDDPWPWSISSRSFGLDLESRVRSVASTVLDGFFLYLAQMITCMRGCVAYKDLWPWLISSRSFGLGLENRVRSVASIIWK